MDINLPQMMPTPGVRKYLVIPASDLITLDYSLLSDTSIETSRVSVDGNSALVEYLEEIEGGYTEEEIITFLEANYWDWNEDTIPRDLSPS